MAFEKGSKTGEGTQFKKGNNFGKGRPKGRKNKKAALKKLIIDIEAINKSSVLSDSQLKVIYQLYQVTTSDYCCNITTTTIKHLYFIESDFGIKIGVSKNVDKRLGNIKEYAPSSVLLKIIPFGGNFEKNLHNKFKKQNIRNNPVYGVEWFYKNEDLIHFISSINEALDLAGIFGSKDIGQLRLF